MMEIKCSARADSRSCSCSCPPTLLSAEMRPQKSLDARLMQFDSVVAAPEAT